MSHSTANFASRAQRTIPHLNFPPIRSNYNYMNEIQYREKNSRRRAPNKIQRQPPWQHNDNQPKGEENSPSARRGAVLAQPAPAELAAHERRARVAHHLAAILALVHLVAPAAVEGVAAVAHADLVVGLELVAPVACCGGGGWQQYFSEVQEEDQGEVWWDPLVHCFRRCGNRIVRGGSP